MKLQVLLLLLSLACVKGLLSRTRAYTEKGQTGDYYDFDGFQADLSTVGFDDVIKSVNQDGIWMYYDMPDYVSDLGVTVIWGVNASRDMDDGYEYSSLRFGGSGFDAYRSAWTVYSEDWLGGPEYYGETSLPSFTGFEISSLLIVGDYSWTFFDSDNWSGDCFCVHPNTDEEFNLMFIPQLEQLYRHVKSVEYGCRDGCPDYGAGAVQAQGKPGSFRYNGKV